MFGLDVPVERLHGIRDVRGCDGNWLVFDLNRAVGGGCPPAEGAPKCAVADHTTRLFFEWDDQGWTAFANTVSGGCADAWAVRPTFPATLCEDLPPVS